MPKVSEFFGIAVYLYHDEHPPAHFHARYGGSWVSVSIETLAVTVGGLPPRSMQLLLRWAEMHRAELRQAWRQASEQLPIDSIEPLR